MIRLALKNWMILTIKGFLTLCFGIIALTFPVASMVFLAKFFAGLLVVSGLTLVIFSISRKKTKDRSWKLSEGFIDIITGTIIISIPEITSGLFISMIAIWISFMGILQISNGYRLRSLYNHSWILLLNGLLAIGFAALIFTYPIHGMVTLAVLIGLQAIVFGGFLVVSSIYLKRILDDISIEIPHKEGEEANQELSYY